MAPRVIIEGVVGSTACGLAREGSDVDRRGVFQVPTRDVLGLSGASLADRSVVTYDPDRTLHEVGKFLRLALEANPTILELLYLPSYEVLTALGQRIIDLRSCFLSTPSVRGRYGGYAMGQARRLLARHEEGKEGFSSDTSGRIEKHARHCYRLLLQGRELLSTGSLTVDVGAARDEIFAVGRLAVSDPAAFNDRFHRELASFDETPSVLPESPERDVVNSLLVELRASDLASADCG